MIESPKSNTRGHTRERPQPTASHTAMAPTTDGRSRPDIRGRAAPAQSDGLACGVPRGPASRGPLSSASPVKFKTGGGCCASESSVLPASASLRLRPFILTESLGTAATLPSRRPPTPEGGERPGWGGGLSCAAPRPRATVETIPEVRAGWCCLLKERPPPPAGGFKYPANGNRQRKEPVGATCKGFVRLGTACC